MSRRFVSDLKERENVDEIYLAVDKQLRANRNGNLYLQLRLSDRTGSITGMLWNANDRLYESFNCGDYLQVQATTQVHQGALQMIVSKINKIDTSKIDEAEFITLTSRDIDGMVGRVSELLRGMENHHLLNLAECFLMDESFMNRFTKAPAGIKNHHAYHGGLLEHVLSLMELVAVVAPRYPHVDQDLLMMGAFLHDAGKIDELTYDSDLGYSDVGQLIGHLVIGVELITKKVREAENLAGEPFPEQLLLRLQHMIVSHHGEYEFGSPKLPMTLEAIALRYLDVLDARLHSVTQLIDSDVTPDGNWTTYHPSLGRKLFKPSVVREETAETT